MPKVIKRLTPKQAKPKLPAKGHRFEITHDRGLTASVREEERRVQTTCFRCHGPKPTGGSWYCPKCEKIVRAAIEVQVARFAGGHS